MKDMFSSEEQQSTNQNKKNKKQFNEKNKESSENDTNMCGRRKEKNCEVKISHGEKDMKNLPRGIQYYIVKRSHIQKIMKEKKNREQRDSAQETMSEEKIKRTVQAT